MGRLNRAYPVTENVYLVGLRLTILKIGYPQCRLSTMQS